MDFNTYINQAWAEHAKDAASVATGFSEAIGFVSKPTEIVQLANLVVHVEGEHLGQFERGINYLKQLTIHSENTADSQAALTRSINILKITKDPGSDISNCSDSDLIRILATSASAHFGQNQIEAAAVKFRSALERANGLDAKDPANRALAISSHNLACSLEEKAELNKEEVDLMLLAARSERRFWEIAGGWLEVERSEYRLAQSFLKARDYISSIKHANLCLTICEKNSAAPLEFFFAYEAIALVEVAMKQPSRSLPQMQKYFDLLPENERPWCEAALFKIKTLGL